MPMKQSSKNRMVRVSFICADEQEAEHVVNEVCELATHRGLSLTNTVIDQPDDDDYVAADGLGIFGD